MFKEVLIVLHVISTIASSSSTPCWYDIYVLSQAENVGNVRNSCLCPPLYGYPISQLVKKENSDLERIIVYYYRDKINNDMYMFTPSSEKQVTIPELSFDPGDDLHKVNNDYAVRLFHPNPATIKIKAQFSPQNINQNQILSNYQSPTNIYPHKMKTKGREKYFEKLDYLTLKPKKWKENYLPKNYLNIQSTPVNKDLDVILSNVGDRGPLPNLPLKFIEKYLQISENDLNTQSTPVNKDLDVILSNVGDRGRLPNFPLKLIENYLQVSENDLNIQSTPVNIGLDVTLPNVDRGRLPNIPQKFKENYLQISENDLNIQSTPVNTGLDVTLPNVGDRRQLPNIPQKFIENYLQISENDLNIKFTPVNTGLDVTLPNVSDRGRLPNIPQKFMENYLQISENDLNIQSTPVNKDLDVTLSNVGDRGRLPNSPLKLIENYLQVSENDLNIQSTPVNTGLDVTLPNDGDRGRLPNIPQKLTENYLQISENDLNIQSTPVNKDLDVTLPNVGDTGQLQNLPQIWKEENVQVSENDLNIQSTPVKRLEEDPSLFDFTNWYTEQTVQFPELFSDDPQYISFNELKQQIVYAFNGNGYSVINNQVLDPYGEVVELPNYKFVRVTINGRNNEPRLSSNVDGVMVIGLTPLSILGVIPLKTTLEAKKNNHGGQILSKGYDTNTQTVVNETITKINIAEEISTKTPRNMDSLLKTLGNVIRTLVSRNPLLGGNRRDSEDFVIPAYRIIGGNAATGSGTPINSRGRSASA